MQAGLSQALMTILPSAMEGDLPKPTRDGTFDFAGFLDSLLPAMEQELAGMPAKTRANLMAEFERDIQAARRMVDTQGLHGLEALLAEGEKAGEASLDPSALIGQLLGMLTAPVEGSAPLPEGEDAIPDTMPESPAADPLFLALQPIPPMSDAALAAEAEGQGAGLPAGLGLAGGLAAAKPMDATEGSGVNGRGQAVENGLAGRPMDAGEGSAEEAFFQDILDAARPLKAHEGMEEMAPLPMEGMPGQAAPSALAQGASQLFDLAGPRGEATEQGETLLTKADDPSALPPFSPESRMRLAQDQPLLERIPVPVQQPRDFGEAVGQRVMFMLGQGMQGARIELNPAELGPMEIQLQVRGSEAHVHFGAAHGLTREAIEAALPRLREMLAEQGFTQVNVNVGQQQGQQAQGFGGGQGQPMPWVRGLSGEGAEAPPQPGAVSILRSGGVDLFA